MKNILLFCFFIGSVLPGISQSDHRFTLGKTDFLLDGKPLQLISAEMHPARIQKEYWRQRIEMAKAMGCNTIAAYVFWNYHEQQEGFFDFTTENRDIAAFVRISSRKRCRWFLARVLMYVPNGILVACPAGY